MWQLWSYIAEGRAHLSWKIRPVSFNLLAVVEKDIMQQTLLRRKLLNSEGGTSLNVGGRRGQL
jgi:hypothetical protein